MSNTLANYIEDPIIYDYYQSAVTSRLYTHETYSLYVLKKEQPNISNTELMFSVERISIHAIIHMLLEDDMIETLFGYFKEYIISSLTKTEHLIISDYLHNSVFHIDLKYCSDVSDRVEKYNKLQSLIDELLATNEYKEYYALNILDNSNKKNTTVRELLKLC